MKAVVNKNIAKHSKGEIVNIRIAYDWDPTGSIVDVIDSKNDLILIEDVTIIDED